MIRTPPLHVETHIPDMCGSAASTQSRPKAHLFQALRWTVFRWEFSRLRSQDRCGTISLLELKEALVGIGSAEAEEMFAILDADRSDEVDYSEFMAALGCVGRRSKLRHPTQITRRGEIETGCTSTAPVQGAQRSLEEVDQRGSLVAAGPSLFGNSPDIGRSDCGVP